MKPSCEIHKEFKKPCELCRVVKVRTIETNPEHVGESYTVIDSNGNFVAKTYSLPEARLVVSAPELLAALKAIAKDSREGYSPMPTFDQMRVARVVIAKAEGR